MQLQQLFREGSSFLQSGKDVEALACFRAAQDIEPANAVLYLYAGAALHNLGSFEEAVLSYRHALDLDPNMGETHNNLGNSLMALGRFDEAAESFMRAAGLLGSSPVPLAARATALQALGKISEAEADCRKAITRDPDFAAAHWNLALNLLLQGRYLEGWRTYEWRWQKPDFTSPLRHTGIPLWDGSPLRGRTILLHAEQGFGDAIQFIRYAPLVAQQGGKVVVECHPQLVSLFQKISAIQAVVSFGMALPPFAVQVPFLSLPRIFGTTLQSVPSQCPYLSIPTEYSVKWAKLVPARRETLRVGLVWAGKNYPDPLRSCPPAELAPLVAVHTATFFSLQLGSGTTPTDCIPGIPLLDLTHHIHDFADTAALIGELDLVISIDTAVAHLAGALGKTVWLLLPFAPDWRWLLERSDSPWYPSMQIFRQKQPGDWGEVLLRVQEALDIQPVTNKKSFEAAPKD